MRERHDRQVGADHRRDLGAAVTRRIDDFLAGDRAAVGMDQPLAGGLALDRGDPRVAVDLGAAVARPLGERLCELRRIDVAVVGVIESGEQPVSDEKRIVLAQLRGTQQLEMHSLRARLRHDVPEFVDTRRRVREPQAPRARGS